MRGYDGNRARPDRYHFLTHGYYLSKHLTLAQRIDCAIDHYRFEEQTYARGYCRAVYQSPLGVTLWQRSVDGVDYEIRLRATEDTRHEGDLSVCCFVNGARVCRVSFSYVDAGTLGAAPGPTIFVTRNQTDQVPGLALFRDTFRQNSPPYFCIAAICGIAMANGMRTILAIRSEAQIAYEPAYERSFRNSYSVLWHGLGARDIGCPHAYSLPIPLQLRPLSSVKHRSRAVARRRNWLEVTLCARRAMSELRASRLPAPAEDDG